VETGYLRKAVSVLLALFSMSCIQKASFVSLNHSAGSVNILPLYVLYDRPVGLECYKHC